MAVPQSGPLHPTLVRAHGTTEALTDQHATIWHLRWIKGTAASFQELYGELERQAHIADSYERESCMPISNRLNDFGKQEFFHAVACFNNAQGARLALIREVEKYLSHVRIPVLKRPPICWTRCTPLPDRAEFMKEMEELEHQATVAIARIANATPTIMVANAKKHGRSGRPTVERTIAAEYRKLVHDWEIAKMNGEKKQDFCNQAGILVRKLNAALQHVRDRKK
jgi:hypothetical protein